MQNHPDASAKVSCLQRRLQDVAFAFMPLVPPASLLFQRLCTWWAQGHKTKQELILSMVHPDLWSIENQLLAYVSLAVIGYVCTDRLIPNIKVRNERSDLDLLFVHQYACKNMI